MTASKHVRKYIQLSIDWTPDFAESLIGLLDEIREVLVAAYGNEIIESNQEEQRTMANESLKYDIPF